jgi:hypothetical protein
MSDEMGRAAQEENETNSDATTIFCKRSDRFGGRYSGYSASDAQRGMIVTLTVVMLLSVGLFLLLGPFEMARATWLLSQST